MKEIDKIKKNKGFTLIELLVVISIIGILVAATSSSFVNSQKKSRDASRKSELKSLSNALNMYYADKGKFPSSITFDGEFKEDDIIYMKKVPVGTSGGAKQMFYKPSSTFKSFRLFANLENSGDGDCIVKSECNTLGYMISNGCCYVITSSNVGMTEVLN